MKSIRRSVFETNSSSTHSISICADEDFKKWKEDGTLLMTDDNIFITRDEAIAELVEKGRIKETDDEEDVNDALRDYDYLTYEEYFESEYLETFEITHTTKSGEVIRAFGKYGYDG